MNCCICGEQITNDDIQNKNFGYDTIEHKVFYRHIKCLLEVDKIFDALEDESEIILTIFLDNKSENNKE